MTNTELARYQIKEDGNVYLRGTLAQLLDKRIPEIGEPTAEDLPKTINPLKFLFNNILKNNCIIAKIDQKAITTDNDYIKLLANLNYVVPPNKAVIVCIKLNTVTDNCEILSNSEDSVGFTPVFPITESMTLNYSDEAIIKG